MNEEKEINLGCGYRRYSSGQICAYGDGTGVGYGFGYGYVAGGGQGFNLYLCRSLKWYNVWYHDYGLGDGEPLHFAWTVCDA